MNDEDSFKEFLAELDREPDAQTDSTEYFAEESAFATPETDRTTFRKSLSSRNAVFAQAVGLTALAAAATSARAGLLIAGITAVLFLVFALLAGGLRAHLKPIWLRYAVYFAVGCALILPFYNWLTVRDDVAVPSMGILFPLLAADLTIAMRCEVFGLGAVPRPTVRTRLIDALGSAVGYALVAVAVGVLRELFGQGRFWGRTIGTPALRALRLPFGGFLLLAAFALLFQLFGAWVRGSAEEKPKKRARLVLPLDYDLAPTVLNTTAFTVDIPRRDTQSATDRAANETLSEPPPSKLQLEELLTADAPLPLPPIPPLSAGIEGVPESVPSTEELLAALARLEEDTK
jgi:Na+-translocating ferredoxin:NAD+ oxidoreductase RnfE subunit